MTQSNTAETREPAIEQPVALAAPTSDTILIETRFGEMAFDCGNSIHMPRGLFGYADHHDFGLANLPDPKLAQFKLMQSLSDADLSFIVAPLNLDTDIVDQADIKNACEILSISFDNTAVLLIVATRKIGLETQVSVNLRAPVIVDIDSQTGWQYVLNNARYEVRHVLSQGVKASDQAEVK